ncbi:IS66-like element accessory protein TnpA [Escherichia coli]|uniref:IS66-like element accessory protein TnpA n=1 Tax=Escherichia coli TaxID=562 RepID=UPI000B7CFC2E|nr:transposase [Escherichia coli]EEY5671699.1 transposase [Escherichia coli]EFC4567457.1 transposase [Escherichia coli]EFO2270303.1 transposase [Escherichia coli]EIQ2127252.1 transposase [Escherichia coli]
MQKNVTPGRRKGCPNYPPEFKQQLVAASCEPGISISKLALENGINANLLFKWRQQWREGKLLLPSSESPQLLPVTLDAAAEQPESLAEDPETLSISCEVTFRHGTLRFNGNVSEKLLTLLIQELKRCSRYFRDQNLAGCRYHRYEKWLQRPGCESTNGAERRSHVRPCFHFPGPQRQSG